MLMPEKTHIRVAAPRKNKPTDMISIEANIGKNMPTRPMTPALLKILEPMILPNAILKEPFFAAEMLTINSGRLVPIARAVIERTLAPTPKIAPTRTKESTVYFADRIRRATLPKMSKEVLKRSVLTRFGLSSLRNAKV